MRRSKFSLSHYKLMTMDMGQLIPLTWFEALPGDSIQHSTSALVRVAPLNAPVMHPVRIRIHHWFVPNRLIWDEWEDFITGGKDGNFTVDPPYLDANGCGEKSLPDYMGVPVGDYSTSLLRYSMLPFRAYNLIYNEHYRDQDLVTEVAVKTTSGSDNVTARDIQNVSWEKDFFTTSRPWEQKGTEVTIPIGGRAGVFGVPGEPPQFDIGGGIRTLETVQDSDQCYWDSTVSGDPRSPTWYDPKLYADLSQATGVTVNQLRFALAIQRYQEARAQYGSRYVEYLRYLGVRSSDSRLQNPEYLGGGRQVIQFSEVLRTGGESDATSPIGELKGHGISAMRTNRYRRFFEEHGIVMTLMSVVPKSIYSAGLGKPWSRTTKEEYFQKELQYIGDQEVKVKEVNAANTNPDATFGYQNRYDEYRWLESDIAGEFNSTLDYWHLARKYSGDVALNSSFINCVPSKRILASTETSTLYVMANHSIQARRMLSKYAKSKTF